MEKHPLFEQANCRKLNLFSTSKRFNNKKANV